jgi:hypothetical protein
MARCVRLSCLSFLLFSISKLISSLFLLDKEGAMVRNGKEKGKKRRKRKGSWLKEQVCLHLPLPPSLSVCTDRARAR